VTKRQSIPIVVAGAAVLLGWVLANPNAKFGLSRFGVTTYSRVPIPVVDVLVREDGAVRVSRKSHDLGAQHLAWLVAGRAPAVLVVGVGWDEAAHLATDFRAPPSTRVVVLPTPEALTYFNALRDAGVRVAIYVHSTC
jgi:hypothetical protein